MTTLATVTRKQIAQLRSEARVSGNSRLVAKCDIALSSTAESAFALLDCLNAIRDAEASATQLMATPTKSSTKASRTSTW